MMQQHGSGVFALHSHAGCVSVKENIHDLLIAKAWRSTEGSQTNSIFNIIPNHNILSKSTLHEVVLHRGTATFPHVKALRQHLQSKCMFLLCSLINWPSSEMSKKKKCSLSYDIHAHKYMIYTQTKTGKGSHLDTHMHKQADILQIDKIRGKSQDWQWKTDLTASPVILLEGMKRLNCCHWDFSVV